MTKTFHLDSSGIQAHIHELETEALADGIGASHHITGSTKADSKSSKTKPTDELSSSKTNINRLFKAHPDGCNACNHTGYKGRIGIYEVLNNSTAVQNLIVANATSDAIQTTAIKEGMLTMQLDGFIKALRGESTIEEILRVTSDS